MLDVRITASDAERYAKVFGDAPAEKAEGPKKGK
jgi:hypothetical protein